MTCLALSLPVVCTCETHTDFIHKKASTYIINTNFKNVLEDSKSPDESAHAASYKHAEMCENGLSELTSA